MSKELVPVKKGKVKSPVILFILFLCTCGIYTTYYLFSLMDDLNHGLGRKEYNPLLEIVLVMVTCGLWGYWLYWRMARSIEEIEKTWHVEPLFDTTILYLLNLFVAGVFFQIPLNRVWETGSMPALEGRGMVPGLPDGHVGVSGASPIDTDGFVGGESFAEEQEEREAAERRREELLEFDARVREGDDTF